MMAKNYTKEHRTVDEQLCLLEERGLLIGDRVAAARVLREFGYYHFGMYLYPMREIDHEGVRIDKFQTGSTFEHASSVCMFDRSLRQLCIEPLERFERALKVGVALTLGKRDKFVHHTGSANRPSAMPKSGMDKSEHERWNDKHNKSIEEAKDPIRSFRLRYTRPFPIWVAVEVMQFGDVTSLLSMLAPEYQQKVAENFLLSDGPAFVSWAHTLREVRNRVAHHDRTWNRKVSKMPRHPDGPDAVVLASVAGKEELHSCVFSALLILAYMMKVLDDESGWARRMRELLRSFPEGPAGTLRELGAPDRWDSDPAWV